MTTPKDLLYTKDHEWIQVLPDGTIRVGITDHAQRELGDVVFVELPTVGDTVDEGSGFAVIESVKAVSDIYAPVSGEVVDANRDLEDSPELINESPYEKGWIACFKMDDPTQVEDLMQSSDYERFIKEA